MAFADDIDDDRGSELFKRALSDLQEALPKGAQVCSCVNGLGERGLCVNVEVFISNTPYQLQWCGPNLTEFSWYLQGHLIPMLWNWRGDYGKFFEMASRKDACRDCGKERCLVFASLKRKSAIARFG